MASASVLEQIRLLHEEQEDLEVQISAILESKPRQYKDALLSDLRVSACVQQGQAASSQLLALYSDADGALRESLNAMAGSRGSGGDDDLLGRFSQRLDDIRSYRRKFPEAGEAPEPSSSTLAAATATLESFSAEELYGKYVDMSSQFEQWTNLPGVKDARTATEQAPAASSSPLLRQDYVGYLRRFNESHLGLPLAPTRHSRQYRKYVADLAAYLVAFFSKVQPLVDVREVLAAITRDFAAYWSLNGGSEAWAAGAGGSGSQSSSAAGSGSGSVPVPTPLLDLASFATQEALAAALEGSPGGAAEQLKLRGLKSGGTPEERLDRLWSVRGLTEFPKRLLASALKGAPSAAAAPAAAPLSAAPPPQSSGGDYCSSSSSGGLHPLLGGAVGSVDPVSFGLTALAAAGLLPSGASGAALLHSRVLTAWLEQAALRVGDVLRDTLAATRRRLEKRQTRTYAELEAERATELEEMTKPAAAASGEGGAVPGLGAGAPGELEEDDDEVPIYNPKNLPLGWDGKPMPYWLWKLQGLNIEYSCEICGDAKIMGRRNFDRHFQEWRHAHGMRSLGIPNTKHFHDITRIADAASLYERIKGQLATETFKPQDEEEYEDSHGTVLNRRTYEDLARAGLL